MTYNVFGGTLNFAQLQLQKSFYVFLCPLFLVDDCRDDKEGLSEASICRFSDM